MMIVTEFGVVSHGPDGSEVSGEFAQFYAWANRSGSRWPCSDLCDLDTISVKFDARGDLVDLTATADGNQPIGIVDISSEELGAWSSDVLAAAGADRLALHVNHAGRDAAL